MKLNKKGHFQIYTFVENNEILYTVKITNAKFLCRYTGVIVIKTILSIITNFWHLITFL
jgi:hypothetical protein